MDAPKQRGPTKQRSPFLVNQALLARAMLRRLLLSGTVLIVSLAIVLTSCDFGGRPPRRLVCQNNLKQVAIALHNYVRANGSFPPAYVADKDGKPMHSWRVLILPFLEEAALYNEYDFSEPWDGPHNSRLTEKCPAVFRCPSASNQNPSATNYVAVVGDRAFWPGSKSVQFQDIKDGLSNTIMLVEVADSDINWMEPRDMAFEQAIVGLNVDKRGGISSNHGYGADVAFGDGSIRELFDDLSPATLKALLTIAGGEKIEMGQDGTFSVCPPATTTPSVPRSGEL